MVFDIKSNILDLVEKIEHLNDYTSDVFTIFYDKLPFLEKNVFDLIKELETLIDYFLKSDTAVHNEQIFSVLTNLFDDLAVTMKKYNSDSPENSLLDSYSTHDDKEEFTFLSTVITDTKYLLKNAELASLNAIIYSSKLGSRGSGFKIIASEIKKIVDIGKQQHANFSRLARELEKSFYTYVNSVTGVFQEKQELLEKFMTEHQDEINGIKKQCEHVATKLQEILAIIAVTLEPIERIMILIQQQDIFRQNCENSVEILSILLEEWEQQNFNHQLYLKATQIIHDILEENSLRIGETLDKIDKECEILLDGLDKLKTDSTYISHLLVSESSKDAIGSILTKIYQLTKSFHAFFEVKEANTQINNSTITKMVKEVEDTLIQITSNLNKLAPLKIFMKIEMGIIQKKFNIEIDKVIEQILDNNSRNFSHFKKLRLAIYQELSDVMRKFEENEQRNQESAEWMDRTKKQLDVIKEITGNLGREINHSIQNITENTREVYQTLDLEKFDNYKRSCLEETNRFLVFLDTFSLSEQNTISEEVQLGLNDLLSKLKTFSERSIAQQVTGFEMDVGSKDGELTLF